MHTMTQQKTQENKKHEQRTTTRIDADIRFRKHTYFEKKTVKEGTSPQETGLYAVK